MQKMGGYWWHQDTRKFGGDENELYLDWNRRKWQPTPVFLPGESQGRWILVGCSPWGCWGRTRLSDFTFTFHFHALEKEMATHSSILAWRIPGTEKPGGLLSMGSHRVRHDWSDLAYTRKWQPTPVLLPGKSHGWRILVGYSQWGHKESDTTEQLYFLFYTHEYMHLSKSI